MPPPRLRTVLKPNRILALTTAGDLAPRSRRGEARILQCIRMKCFSKCAWATWDTEVVKAGAFSVTHGRYEVLLSAPRVSVQINTTIMRRTSTRTAEPPLSRRLISGPVIMKNDLK